ncbi:MAG: hypothetical protein H6R21_3153, partial [Proteobacteria bacterium]|nr:hypothetical protein [Pseudomonadota bacterium]
MKLSLLALLFLLTGLVLWARIAQSSDLPQVGQAAPTFQLPDQTGTA